MLTRRNAVKGFTLIELMIVVVMVGILSAIAIPSYQNYVIRTKRGDAMASLQAAAQALERYRSNNGFNYGGASLTGGGGNVVFTNQVPVEGGRAYYSLDFGAGVAALAAGATTFTVRAVPVPGSTQASDGTLTLTSTGTKTWGAKTCWPTQGNDC